MTRAATPQTGRPVRGGLFARVGDRFRGRRLRGLAPLRLVVPLLVVGLAAVVRFVGLDVPDRIYFDETYYVDDARAVLDTGVEEERPAHPPVGKWPIAAGIALFGDGPVGWRVAPALAGTLSVLLAYLAGLRLFRSVALAGLGALLLAVDGLALTMSRIGMLDAFLGLFVLLAFWLLLVDRDARDPGDPAREAPVRRVPPRLAGSARWLAGSSRWLAGGALGLALGTKWTALLMVAAALLLVGLTDLRRNPEEPFGRRLARTLRTAGAPLLVVPALVYVATYGSWFVNFSDTWQGERYCAEEACPAPLSARAVVWGETQVELLRYHRDLEATHPYRSSALGWPVLARPVLYYLERCPQEEPEREEGEEACVVSPGNTARILGLGNPAVWWTALLAYPVVAWRAVRGDRAARWLLAPLLLLYLPWLVSWRQGYLFYLLPAVPFVALAVAHAVGVLTAGGRRRWLPWAVAALATAVLAWLWPIYAGAELSPAGERARIWFGSWR